MKDHIYYVYILSNSHITVFYTGVTNNLERRCFEHKNKITKGFTSKYNINCLVYFETYDSIEEAIQREKQVKRYTKSRKMKLIQKINPGLKNLYVEGKPIYPKV